MSVQEPYNTKSIEEQYFRMLRTLPKTDARDRMNTLGSRDIPFLFVLDYRMQNNIVLPLDEVDENEILFSFKEASNAPREYPIHRELLFTASPLSFAEYLPKFNIVRGAIERGDSYLVNLTAETALTMNYTLPEIFAISNAPYKLLLNEHCTVFSPETFVTIDDGTISTCPMKGTIDAAIPNAAQIILNDEKETAEQNTIVDLMRNDLNMIAKNVRVDRYRYIGEIESRGKRLLQVSSKISGELDSGYPARIGDLIMAMLPAGSITGAPKKRTVEIIGEAEGYERGYYTGVFGYFANGKLDSAVMIRYIEKRGDGYVFKSGGGITHLSDPKKEYQELIDKIYVPIA